MGIYVLTSMFPNGFPVEVAQQLNRDIQKRGKFAFVASEFEKTYEKTDRYFNFFLNMFTSCGIVFDHTCVVDARMDKEQMQNEIKSADVVWLAGGNTPGQFQSFEKYGLVPILRDHQGVIIEMSAGAINMAKIVVCSTTCGAIQKEIYSGLGLVDISVEPHFDKRGASEELLQISMDYPLYGLCDDSMILFENGNMTLTGDVFIIDKGSVKRLNGVTL